MDPDEDIPREEAMYVSRVCWYKFKKVARLVLYTPFVVCLASGTLKNDTFLSFLGQDNYYYKAFAKAYKAAEKYTDDDDAKYALRNLQMISTREFKIQDSFLQEWDDHIGKQCTLNPITLKFTEFLQATASGRIEGVSAGNFETEYERTKLPAYIFGALVPCLRLYANLGKELLVFLQGNTTHQYRIIIQNYASESLEEFAKKNENLLDELSITLTTHELSIIEKLYHKAMKIELGFLLGQPLDQKSVIPISREHNLDEERLVIFFKFDETCSVIDSSAIFAEMTIVSAPKSDENQSAPKSDENQSAPKSDENQSAPKSDEIQSTPKSDENQSAPKSDENQSAPKSDEIQSAPKSDENQPENQLVRLLLEELNSTWDGICKDYREEYEQCIDTLLLTHEKAEKLDYERLHKALEQLSDFEKRANTRVSESGVLRGLKLEEIKRVGELMVLQDGCKTFFQSIIKNEQLNVDIHALSCCWCSDLIRSAFSSDGLDVVHVHANEIIFEENISTGVIVKKVECPFDKVQVFSEVLNNYSNDKKNLTVHIGDTMSDLLCLLQADIGIVISPSPNLIRVGNHFGASFIPLHRGIVEKQKAYAEKGTTSWNRLSGVIYTVSSWAEIHMFIQGSIYTD